MDQPHSRSAPHRRGGEGGGMRAQAFAVMAGLVFGAVGTGCNPADENDESANEVFQRMERSRSTSTTSATSSARTAAPCGTPPAGTISREWSAQARPRRAAGHGGRGVRPADPHPAERAAAGRGPEAVRHRLRQCHGGLGDGNSIVGGEHGAAAAPVVPAAKDCAGKPDGHFYDAITEGYGVMPSFAGEMDIHGALGGGGLRARAPDSQAVPLAEAPADVRARLPQENR